MSRTVRIESECVAAHLDLPKHLDHAWLFIAAGIHERLYSKTVDDRFVPRIVEGFWSLNGASKNMLEIGRDHSWSDGKPITSGEVSKVLYRGIATGIFSEVRVVGPALIAVEMANDIRLSAELLASAIFSVTPSCRTGTSVSKRNVTTGPYVLAGSSANRRAMHFKKRYDSPSSGQGPELITIGVTENRDQGLRLLRAGALSLSCPLGAEPHSYLELGSSNKISNRATNLGLVLRPYPGCALAHDAATLTAISRSLCRTRLAMASGNTFLSMGNLSALFGAPEAPQPILHYHNAMHVDRRLYQHLELRYAAFEPNRQIAEELSQQLAERFGICCSLVPVSYADYVASRYRERSGLSLEIIQPLLPESILRSRWDVHDLVPARCDISTSAQVSHETRPSVIPLLQAVTTLISFDARYRGKRVLTSEALLDWSQL